MKYPPKYRSFSEKAEYYLDNVVIDTEYDLVGVYNELKQKESDGYIFRGLNNASFKSYSSAQREWIAADKRKRNSSFSAIVNTYINSAHNSSVVHNYIKKEKVQENEMFLMALLQHFGCPSPLLDFSTSLNKALFFCIDGLSGRSILTHYLKDYMSLYYIDARRIDWAKYSLQDTMRDSAEKLEMMLFDLKENDPHLYAQFISNKESYNVEVENFELLPFQYFYKASPDNRKDYPLQFIKLDAGKDSVSFSIPEIGLNCNYTIINDRILRQDGLFFFDNTKDKPLAELMKDDNIQIIHCVNIHKSLKSIIRNKYLVDIGGHRITRNSVYGLRCKSIQIMKTEFERIYSLNKQK